MDKFILKEIINTNLSGELSLIGFDSAYKNKAEEKFLYKNIKIFDLSLAQANILKQTALSFGADCAVHRDIITAKTDKSDVILGGSISQIKKIADKLKYQPFSLKILSEEILKQLETKTNKTQIVGILNVTDNSFSDGGEYIDTEIAKKRLTELYEEGADIVDIGAESTKPNATSVTDEEQLKRLLPLITPDYPISIDTRSSHVAEECLKLGAKIINDVSGLKYDNKMAETIAKYNATVVIQHSINIVNQGSNVEKTENIIDKVYMDLNKQIEYAKSEGIKKIITDVGIGFDKTREENFELLNRISEFKSLGYPVMLGISRKSFINSGKNNNEKDIFTLALNSLVIENKIDYVRVHNVKLHKQLINLLNNLN